MGNIITKLASDETHLRPGTYIIGNIAIPDDN